jgi:hypothetical protein
MQTQLSETVLSKPEHVLSFIKHALGSAAISGPDKPSIKKGLGLSDLRIVKSEDEVDGTDSDDDDDLDALEESGGGKDGMTITSLTLLLSVLEGMLLIVSVCGGLYEKSYC